MTVVDALVDALVDAGWLASHIDDPDICILDASWHLPATGRSGLDEFTEARIPRGQFFDINAIADRDTDLPHMLPTADGFATAVRALGVSNNSHVVVYDGDGLFSAARAWWMFRVFGHDRVSVLDGGRPAYEAGGHPLERGAPGEILAGTFEASFRPELVRSIDQMRKLVDSGAQIVDARGAGRFAATSPEPRAGVRGGHMPGARNLPYSAVENDDKTLLDPDAIRAKFEALGVDLSAPITTTCGSGVTAAVLALALAIAGADDVAVYDGSWTEWGGRDDTPIVQDG